MNKEYYKSAFSMVCPSEEAIERVLSMTEKIKRKRIFGRKSLIIVLAVIAALICGTFTVNAATDGKLFGNIRVVLNGEEVNPEEHNIKCKAYVDDEGNKIAIVGTYDSNGNLQGACASGNIGAFNKIHDGNYDKLLEENVDSFSEDKDADLDVNIDDTTTETGGHCTNVQMDYK